jgi:DNA-binding PadR family transcriptional regulator
MRVMRTLQDSPAGLYGLEVVEKSEGGVKRGSVYVFLGQLEEKGFVRVLAQKESPQNGGLPRPKYQLTAEGARVVRFADVLGIQPAGA